VWCWALVETNIINPDRGHWVIMLLEFLIISKILPDLSSHRDGQTQGKICKIGPCISQITGTSK
jgi:hypothetical protein